MLAVGLMVGFYVLAVGVAGALLYLPYAEMVYFNRVHPKLLIFSLLGAGAIVWSILPRWDKFVAPGPEIRREEQPELFGLIGEVARKTGQAEPKHVYATLEVNAWVTERGGIMGLGSRRVMGLGLPLLEALTVDEFRAVLAHEFGHYLGGDTKLGPWIYKTRSAIGRSLARLDEDSWIRMPFVMYAKMFLRVTSAVSRQEEFAADAVAARVASAGALASGLKKLGGAAAAFDAYWRQEVAPVLSQAKRPPLAQGFAAFLGVPAIAERLAEVSAKELQDAEATEYDSHPTTAARCAALEKAESGKPPGDGRAATALVRGMVELEGRVLAGCVDAGLAEAPMVKWSSVAEDVWLAQWRSRCLMQGPALEGLSIGDLASLAVEPAAMVDELHFDSDQFPDGEEKLAFAKNLLAMALGVALFDAGWRVRGEVGEPLYFQSGEVSVQPFELLEALATDETARKSWSEWTESEGLAGLALRPRNPVV